MSCVVAIAGVIESTCDDVSAKPVALDLRSLLVPCPVHVSDTWNSLSLSWGSIVEAVEPTLDKRYLLAHATEDVSSSFSFLVLSFLLYASFSYSLSSSLSRDRGRLSLTLLRGTCPPRWDRRRKWRRGVWNRDFCWFPCSSFCVRRDSHPPVIWSCDKVTVISNERQAEISVLAFCYSLTSPTVISRSSASQCSNPSNYARSSFKEAKISNILRVEFSFYRERFTEPFAENHPLDNFRGGTVSEMSVLYALQEKDEWTKKWKVGWEGVVHR